MNLNLQKAEFSYAYIATVASAAGFVVEKKGMPMDYIGVDISVETPGTIHDMFAPVFHAQVKCTSSKILHDAEVRFALPVRNYDTLRKLSFNDQYLIIVSVPDEPMDWIYTSEDKTLLQYCAYFHSLKGYPEAKNKDNVTIRFSRDQLLTPDSLKSIMIDIAESRKKLLDNKDNNRINQ